MLRDLAIPALIGAGILMVVMSKRNSAIVAPVDIAAAPDPVKCKAYDDAKVNSKLVNEPCSQVCSSETGDAVKCKDCETVCGKPNCGCYGSDTTAGCNQFGPLADGCPNTRTGDTAAADDNEDSGGGGGGGDNTSGQNAEEYDEDSPAAKALAKRINAGLYARSFVPLNWT